jgi:TIR domain
VTHIFLSYAKEDADRVRRLHARLQDDGFQPWLDEHDLLPGQEWEHAIQSAIRTSGAFIAALSVNAISKTGFIQKEIREALEVAERMPDGKVFIVPVRLDECIVPERLRPWQWIDLFRRGGYDRLRSALMQHVGARAAVPRLSRPPLDPKHPADILVFDHCVRSGRFIYAPLGRRQYAMSQGHFLVVRSGLPKEFKDLKGVVADYRALSKSWADALLPASAPWRRSGALVKRIDPSHDLDWIMLSSDESTCCLNPDYWRLGMLAARMPRVYINNGKDGPVYFEDNDVTVAIVMPLRLSDEELKRLRKEV